VRENRQHGSEGGEGESPSRPLCMVQQVLAEPTWQGRLTPTDLRALTPLKWLHVNPYGTFTLNMHERLLREYAA